MPPFIHWAFVDAVWVGDGREACIAPGTGACWAFVEAKFAQFMYGRYPIDERWRVNLTGILLVAGLVPMAIPRVPFKRENAIFLLVVFPIVALILLTGGHFDFPIGLRRRCWSWSACLVDRPGGRRMVAPTPAGQHGDDRRGGRDRAGRCLRLHSRSGDRVRRTDAVAVHGPDRHCRGSLPRSPGCWRSSRRPTGRAAARCGSVWAIVVGLLVVVVLLSVNFGLPYVETQLWGGLLVTLVVAIVGMVASLPLGVLLALGRRSNLPVVKFCSIVFIEFWRGVPLITVLFMASVMLPVFLPPGVNFDKLLRALIGVALFTSAYMAEVVRGGLQAIPKGQYEGAKALGLTYWQMMRMIILPQALKIVIPGIVNSFISLFKDTSLVLIIGLFDLLGIVQLNFTDSNWASLQDAGDRLRLRRLRLLALLLRHVALLHVHRAPARHRPQALNEGSSDERNSRRHRRARTSAHDGVGHRRRHRDHRHEQVVRRVPRAAGTSTSRSCAASASSSAGRRAPASRP